MIRLAFAVLLAGIVVTPAFAEREELVPYDESPRDLRWKRLFAEAGLLFAIVETKYALDKDANKYDFEYGADWQNVRARFLTFEAWKLDDNFFNTNGWRHTGQGGLNYLFARSNGFSAVQSYVFSLAMSAAWEFFGEYKEEVSFNDLIVTPRSGAVTGEAVWQLGVFFLRGQDNLFNHIAGNVLTLGRGYWNQRDGKRSWHARSGSALGFDTAVPHRFVVSTAAGIREQTGAPTQTIWRVALDTELLMIPGFARPGSDTQLRTTPSFSQIHAQFTRATNAKADVDFRAFARTAVTMWHRKSIADNGDGWNLLYGLSSAYEYGHHSSRDRDTKLTQDRIAVAHLLGPTVDLSVRNGRWSARAVFDAYADFGLLRNHALDTHREMFPDVEVRSTIVRDNYYHALGMTGMARLEASLDSFSAGATYQLNSFRSVQGLDRNQEDLVDDYSLFDQRREARLWARVGFSVGPDLRAELEVAAEQRHRSGRVKETEVADGEQRYFAGVQLAF